MSLLDWICWKRFEHHMRWHDLYRRQADTARSQIEAASRLGVELHPSIHRVLEDAERLAEQAWNRAQRWA